MSYNKQMVVGSSWKIYFKTIQEAKEYIKTLGSNIDFVDSDLLEIYTLPDFISLGVISTMDRNNKIRLGAQDMFWEDYGAFTGEVSPLMLKDIGCKYIYIGHSERRKYFGEDNHTINKKVLASYRNGLIPILLVGETRKEYEKDQTAVALKEQLSISLKGIPAYFMEKLILVYEPVWAIGRKDSASPEVINQSHKMVRKTVSELYDSDTGLKTRIIYGGSVNYQNSRDIIQIPEVDGLAITRGALDPLEFIKIIRIVDKESRSRASRKDQT